MVTVAVVVVVMGGAGPDDVNPPGPFKEGNNMTRFLTLLWTSANLSVSRHPIRCSRERSENKNQPRGKKKMEDDQKD